ncbi:MAG: polysaccharide biosynthesis/export family protein [Nitrospira sp.]
MLGRAVMCLLAIGGIVISGGCSKLPREVLDQASRQSPKEFLLGSEDILEVTVWRNQDLSRTVVIRPDGMISLPLIGDVHASGLTASQVADRIAKRLTEFKENPSVSVSLREVNSYVIYVNGEVTRPGKYPLKSFATVLQGVSLAGGFTPFASKNKMVVVRIVKSPNGEEAQVRIPVRYDDLVKGDGEIGNFTLMSGDTIVVP